MYGCQVTYCLHGMLSGGVRVPVLTFDPLTGFQNLPGQMFEWQGGCVV